MRISVHKKSTGYDGTDIRMFMDVTERSGFFICQLVSEVLELLKPTNSLEGKGKYIYIS